MAASRAGTRQAAVSIRLRATRFGATVRSQRSPSREALRRDKPAARPQPLGSLDRLIHERLRLGIVSALAVNERLTFNDLKRLLETTDGNLSVHARKLEDAEYIAVEKSFAGRVPRTEYRLTAAGSARWRNTSPTWKR